MGIRMRWWRKKDPCEDLVKRIQELEDALDHIARVGLGSRTPSTRTKWITARAISALDEHNMWEDLPTPPGYHEALERTSKDYL